MEGVLAGLSSLGEGTQHRLTQGVPNLIMIGVAMIMFYLAIRKGVEPLLLLPIAFGCLLVNLPLSEVSHAGGILKTLYDFGICNELFPLLIFVGIGAMTDFSPLLASPRLLLFGAAGQAGIFLALLLALALGFSKSEAVSIVMVGACDGPTVIYVANLFTGRGHISTTMVGPSPLPHIPTWHSSPLSNLPSCAYSPHVGNAKSKWPAPKEKFLTRL